MSVRILPVLLLLAACQPSQQQSAAQPAAPASAPASAVAASGATSASSTAASGVSASIHEARFADYKRYAQEQTAALVRDTEAFVAAVKAGDMDKAKALYAAARAPYERIEPIASLFSELDEAIDVREDDFKQKAKDPAFGGFHRIEYALWVEKNTQAAAATADKLLADVKALNQAVGELAYSEANAAAVVGGAAELIEEVAADKITGEENRYSRADLSDFQANLDGSKKIVEIYQNDIDGAKADTSAKLKQQFADIETVLGKYREGDGFKSYDSLSEDDRKVLKTKLNALAEELAKLRGLLGLG